VLPTYTLIKKQQTIEELKIKNHPLTARSEQLFGDLDF